MNKQLAFCLLSGILLSYSTPLIAQEQDDFSDYSYLWEDKKKKKKKKEPVKEPVTERQAPETEPVKEPAVFSDPEPMSPIDTVPETSTAPAPIDSSYLYEPSPEPVNPEIMQDTLPDFTEPLPEEEIEDDPLLEEEEFEEEEKEVREPKEKKERKEKKDLPPVDDFRAGLPASETKGSFTGGFTFTEIDGQYYAGMVLSPEFSLGKVGVGLNVPILYGLEEKSIRTEIFKDGVGVARLVRYLRLGNQKRDPFYLRIGELSNTMIGYGGLINNYTNTTSFEKRKVGLHYDVNVKGLAGIEGLYSDFDPSSLNLLAIRPYVRPLARSGIPIARTLEAGFQYITDKDQTAIQTSDSTSRTYNYTSSGVGGIGFDMGLTLLSIPFIQIDLFTSYSRLNVGSVALKDTLGDDFIDGSGFSTGLNFRFHFIADLLSTDVRIERLTYTRNYLPQFFDATYEINKDAKLLSLGTAPKMSGIYGSLQGQILHKVLIGGSLMIPDDISDDSPALVRVNADLERLADKVSLHASYIKGNLNNLNDAFKFDENSLAKVRFIYHMNKFLAAGLDYYWAFAPAEDGSYKATRYVSPYFGLSIQF